MKTIEKEFVTNLKNILANKSVSVQNKYFVTRIIDIFNNNNMDSINIINIKDFSFLMDYFNYESYNRGLLIVKILVNNFKIIDSKPYSKVNFLKYRSIYEKRNISFEQFIMDVKYLINSEDIKLDEYYYEIFKMLQCEEKNRLNKVKEAKIIKLAYENLNIEKIVKYFEYLNLSEKDIEGVKIYLSTLKDIKAKKQYKGSNLTIDLKVSATKLGYTNKEIKKMNDELNYILKEINENGIKISYEDYLKYVKYALILEEENKACEADIDQLYEALIVDENSYCFIINKANSMLQTNKAIDIQNILQDINDIENILKCCDECDKKDFNFLLKNMYENLYYINAYNHNYERKLLIN